MSCEEENIVCFVSAKNAPRSCEQGCVGLRSGKLSRCDQDCRSCEEENTVFFGSARNSPRSCEQGCGCCENEN